MQPTATLSVSALARDAAVSVQTLRHYDGLGLLTPTLRTAAGYRRYTEADRARLALIRALRSLDFDLSTIASLLQGAQSTRAVLELHLRALDLQAQAVTRRRAVLRTLLDDGGELSLVRLQRLQGLAAIDGRERARFVQTALDARLRGAAYSTLHDLVRRSAAVEFPESPTDVQLAAWLELAEMVADESFLARHRERSELHAAPSTGDMVAMAAICQPAADAVRRGVPAGEGEGLVIVQRWIDAMLLRRGHPVRESPRMRARALLDAFTSDHDPRETRFWELMAALNPALAQSPVSMAWPWLMEGLRILSGDPEQ